VPVPVGLFLGARKREELSEPQRKAIEAHKRRLDPLDRDVTSDRLSRPLARAGMDRPEAPSTDWTHLRTVFQSDLHSSVYQLADPAEVQQETLAIKLAKARKAAAGGASAVDRVRGTFGDAERWDSLAASGRLSEARHPDKAKARRGVTAVSVTQLVPDAARWEESPLAAMFDSDPAAGSGVGEEGGGVLLRQTPDWARRGVSMAEDGLPMQAFVRSAVEESTADGGEAWVLGQQCTGRVMPFDAGDEHILVATERPIDQAPAPAEGEAASGAGAAPAGWAPVGASIQLVRARPRRRPGTEPIGAAEPGHVVSVAREAMSPDDADAREEATLPLWSEDPETDAVIMHAKRAQRRLQRAKADAERARRLRAAGASSSSSSSSAPSGRAGRAASSALPRQPARALVTAPADAASDGASSDGEFEEAARPRRDAEDRAAAVASGRSAMSAAIGGLFDDDDDADEA